jgi:hypothetical protein
LLPLPQDFPAIFNRRGIAAKVLIWRHFVAS